MADRHLSRWARGRVREIRAAIDARQPVSRVETIEWAYLSGWLDGRARRDDPARTYRARHADKP